MAGKSRSRKAPVIAPCSSQRHPSADERLGGLRFGDVSRGDAKRYFGGGGLTGTTGVWVFEPHPTDFAAQMKNAQPKTLMVYGGADALTEENALAIYFKKYRMKPRGSQYRMPYHARIRTERIRSFIIIPSRSATIQVIMTSQFME